MVSVNNNSSSALIRDVYLMLLEALGQMASDSLETAWASWIYPKGAERLQPVLPDTFSVNHYQHVAQLGFLLDSHEDLFKHLLDQLQDGLKRTAGRPIEHVNGEPAPFRNDPIALLGLATGAKRVGGDTQQLVKQWLESFVDPTGTSHADWKAVILVATLATVGTSVDDRDIHKLTASVDLQLALLSRGINAFRSVDFNAGYQSINQSVTEKPMNLTLVPARLQALDYLMNHLPAVSISQPTVAQVATLLNRIPAAFKRWPWEEIPKTPSSTIQLWDVQNEYHVQSLVYFLLAPIFPDIESEFYLESTGALNPRADIGLPSLNLIIEIKFLRQSKSFSKIMEEVAADASLYFKPNSVYKQKYTRMLVLLWDDSSRTHEHQVFKNGVRELANVEEAVVMARPGILIKPTKTTPPKAKSKK